ncbi:hypothetical protein SSP35_07_02090 [Streptomyces sp. NBRC 110611]|nr:hypothetical protein SSP35_07_02090 [Streptomyces sp. NBRC 110611]
MGASYEDRGDRPPWGRRLTNPGVCSRTGGTGFRGRRSMVARSPARAAPPQVGPQVDTCSAAPRGDLN